MSTAHRGKLVAGALALSAALLLSACSSGNALGGSSSTAKAASGTIAIGSAPGEEAQIVAYIYAGALNAKGIKTTVNDNVGQRNVLVKALQDGSIDLEPDYSGNLLQFFDASTTAKTAADVASGLKTAAPKGLEVLNAAPGTDADSYNVTKAFSEKYKVTSLSQLAGLNIPLVVGANPEFQTRPYGIPGLESIYGVKNVTLSPINDGGGPNTQQALNSNQVQLADIYTTTPAIKNYVTLKDPKHMILPQQLIPLIATKKATAQVKSILNAVSAKITTDELISMNEKNLGSQKLQPNVIAQQFLKQYGFTK